jgi:hypothetical protein
MTGLAGIPTRRLGKTGISVTVVGFGGIPIQAADEEQAVATVRRAYDMGVRFFDTARGYTTSEERIGKALEGRDCVMASKSSAGDAETMYRHVCTSLALLRRDHIALYQLHGVNDDEELARRTAPGGALDGLRRARDDGKISHIGITGHRRETLVKAVETCDDFAAVQVPFNLVERDILDALVPICAARDVGVIAMKPVGGGNFTNAPLAIKWCINQPITAAIPGMASVAEVEADVAAGCGDIRLTAAELEACEQMRSELDQRTCRRCRYCEPCPHGVQIGMLLHGRTIIRRMGVSRFFDFGAREVIASAAHCEQCGACVTKCPYQLPIPDLIREVMDYYRTFPELRGDLSA